MSLWYKKGSTDFLVPLEAVHVTVRMMAGFSQIKATLTYMNRYSDQPIKNIQFDYPLKQSSVVTSLIIVIGQSIQVEQKVYDK